MNNETGRLIPNEEYEKLKEAAAKEIYTKIDTASLTEKQLAKMQVSPHDNRSIAGKIRIQHKNSKRNLPCPCGSGKKFKKCCWHKVA